MSSAAFPLTATACVLTSPGHVELRDFTIPKPDVDSGVLEIEACGVCGADVEIFAGHGPPEFEPVALGHEMVGRIVDVGVNAAVRWDVTPGDRVVVNEVIPCGNCRLCAAGDAVMCNGFFGTHGSRYGFIPTTTPPGAWGGFATHVQLHPNSQLRRISRDVPTAVAAMFMPVANAVHWLFDLAGLRPYDSVLVVGPGPQGLAVSAVAGVVGLRTVVAGRSCDAHRLALATMVGASEVVNIEEEDVIDAVKKLTRGAGVDAVVITTSGADSVLSVATRCVRVGGIIVLAGTNGWKSEQTFKGDALVFRNITVRGAPGHSVESVERAIRLLEAHPNYFTPLIGDEYPLHAVSRALADPFAAAGGVHRSVVPRVTSG